MKKFWGDKRILLTGHTGFKGSWLAEILLKFGGRVTGCSLPAIRHDDLFHLCELEQQINHHIIDVRNKMQLSDLFEKTMPDVVFHLAAQPLVLPSYTEPTETWETNVFGTINVLESLKTINKKCAVVMVTTDKVYELDEFNLPKKENDNLGGHDPYSSSKAAMEIAVSSWRRSFFSKSQVSIATARSGNVIGGGDWSERRIIPDLVRSLVQGTDLEIRNPNAVRPWQHVLEPLFGYMKLAEALYNDDQGSFETSFNFGPDKEFTATVNDLVSTANEIWGKPKPQFLHQKARHEASFLALDNSKARELLGWYPRWSFADSVFHTIDWYKSYFVGSDPASLIKEQIDAYYKTL
ncbi:CDP-glucose 4,6-dehydratase [Alphaproteobacteria bacterium]|nr:CDP-glucose 4,6-dehydratase [Alphaproteobacteria bacterium]